jgi:hypothetical protein
MAIGLLLLAASLDVSAGTFLGYLTFPARCRLAAS